MALEPVWRMNYILTEENVSKYIFVLYLVQTYFV